MMDNKKGSEFVCSNSFYDITNFVVVAFVLGMIQAFPFIICEYGSLFWQIIFIIISFVVASLVSSMLYLKTTKFYKDTIEVHYSLNLFNNLNKHIALVEIKELRYTYTGGRGSGGVGQLIIKFIKQGKVRTIKCTLDKDSAADVILWANKNNIPVKINPSHLFDR